MAIWGLGLCSCRSIDQQAMRQQASHQQIAHAKLDAAPTDDPEDQFVQQVSGTEPQQHTQQENRIVSPIRQPGSIRVAAHQNQQRINHQGNEPLSPKAVPQKLPTLPSLTQKEERLASDIPPKNQTAATTTGATIGSATAGAERFSLKVDATPISKVIDMLGKYSDMNILLGKGVTGTISVNLRDVTVDEAMHSILESQGYVSEKKGNFLYIRTVEDAKAHRQRTRKLISKIYRPYYISVKDLQALITPLLTPKPIGKISVTVANEMGLDTDPTKAGGDLLSQQDALLIQDYDEVLKEVDRVIAEMDVPPLQVVIEAMILQVTLSDRMSLGVNFALLSNSRTNLVVSGNGQQLNSSSKFPGAAAGLDKLIPAAGSFISPAFGLKYGFLRGDLSGFIEALETVGDTNLIASPQIRVLNKRRANLIIGDRLGFSTFTNNGTETIQNISFLDVGTKLTIRPFIAPDGLIRLEVHPEQSSGKIDGNGIPQSSTTEVTTNVMVRDGATVVLGGLIETNIIEENKRIPLLGSLPWIGPLFQQTTESTERRELIVLITPRIVSEQTATAEGAAIQHEQLQRSQYVQENLSPINRDNLARFYLQLAQKSYERGELLKAKHRVNSALRYSKNDKQALRLREQILDSLNRRTKKWVKPLSFLSK